MSWPTSSKWVAKGCRSVCGRPAWSGRPCGLSALSPFAAPTHEDGDGVLLRFGDRRQCGWPEMRIASRVPGLRIFLRLLRSYSACTSAWAQYNRQSVPTPCAGEFALRRWMVQNLGKKESQRIERQTLRAGRNIASNGQILQIVEGLLRRRRKRTISSPKQQKVPSVRYE